MGPDGNSSRKERASAYTPRQKWAWCVSEREGDQCGWIRVSKVEKEEDMAQIAQGSVGHCKSFGCVSE